MVTASAAGETSAIARVRRVFRPVFAVTLALHGVVHWIGFAVPFGLMTTESNTFTTAALWGSLELGDAGAKVLGVAYLALIVPFVAAAVGILRDTWWALPLTAVAAVLSAVVCALGSPNAIVGLVLNVVIFATVVLAPQLLSSRGHTVRSRRDRMPG